MIENLELQLFTAFTNLKVDFSPKINVIIGENGTGKTQLLKAAYAIYFWANFIQSHPELDSKEQEAALAKKFFRLFMPIEDRLSCLRYRGQLSMPLLKVKLSEVTQTLEVGLKTKSNKITVSHMKELSSISTVGKPVLIPTKEVLSLLRGVNDTRIDHQTLEKLFDDTYLDLIRALFQEPQKKVSEILDRDPRLGTILPRLSNTIGGRYSFNDGQVCFQSGEYVEKKQASSKSKQAKLYSDSTKLTFVPVHGGELSNNMTAEGFRKIGILQRLLENGTLNLGGNGTLFWDEPEANLNPKLMKRLVEILLELSRNGQQIILATHDYVLLKWFDLLRDKSKDDHVRFHTLYREEDSGVIRVDSVDNFRSLNSNAISDTFAEIYDEDVKRALGGNS